MVRLHVLFFLFLLPGTVGYKAQKNGTGTNGIKNMLFCVARRAKVENLQGVGTDFAGSRREKGVPISGRIVQYSTNIIYISSSHEV